MKKLNLNSIIYVKLSDFGKSTLQRYYDEINAQFSEPIELYLPEPNEYGFYEFPVWKFMYIFGKFFVMGAPQSHMPLEDLNIYIAEQDLEEMCK